MHAVCFIEPRNSLTPSTQQHVIFLLLFFSEAKVLVTPSFTQFNKMRQDVDSISRKVHFSSQFIEIFVKVEVFFDSIRSARSVQQSQSLQVLQLVVQSEGSAGSFLHYWDSLFPQFIPNPEVIASLFCHHFLPEYSIINFHERCCMFCITLFLGFEILNLLHHANVYYSRYNKSVSDHVTNKYKGAYASNVSIVRSVLSSLKLPNVYFHILQIVAFEYLLLFTYKFIILKVLNYITVMFLVSWH